MFLLVLKMTDKMRQNVLHDCFLEKILYSTKKAKHNKTADFLLTSGCLVWRIDADCKSLWNWLLGLLRLLWGRWAIIMFFYICTRYCTQRILWSRDEWAKQAWPRPKFKHTHKARINSLNKIINSLHSKGTVFFFNGILRSDRAVFWWKLPHSEMQ